MLKRLAAGLAWTALMFAQSGTTPKPKAADYPAHGRAGDVEIGAEYLVRSVGTGNEMIVVHNCLTFEVALYPPKGARPDVQPAQFSLRINGKKTLLLPQTPQMAAASLKYPEYEMRPSLEASGGMGDRGVIIGRQPRVERFPGDNRPAQTRPPGTATVEGGPSAPEELVVEAALPEGPAAGPVSGYVYFPFRGKPKSIKSLELIYHAGDASATLRFF